MLLGIASSIPDYEPLLQKHFFAVLSSSWKDKSRSSHTNRTLSSQNGFYSSQKVGSSMNNQNLSSKSSEKLEFTNLRQCGNLVAAALNSDSSRQADDGFSINFNRREDDLVPKERLDVTLELQEESDEASSFPSFINVSILGPDAPPSLKLHAGEDHHFRSSRALIENQFRYGLDVISRF